MKKSISLFVLVALVFSVIPSCNIENQGFVPEGESQAITFTALQESVPAFRTEVSGTKVLWSPGDSISIFYKTNGYGSKFVNTAAAPSETAEFTGVLNQISSGGPDGESFFLAVYPHNANNYFDPDYTYPGVSVIYFSTVIPAAQTAEEGTFAQGSFPSVARSKDTRLYFYNLCGGVVLRFADGCQDISSVTFTGNRGEWLAGEYGYYWYPDETVPVRSENLGYSNTVTLNSPSGGFKPGVDYFISMLPATLSQGFSLLFRRSSDSKVAVKRFTKPQEVKRSTFGRISGFDSDLQWVEETEEDALALVQKQWVSSSGGLLDLGVTAPGYFGFTEADGVTIALSWFSKFEKVVKNVYGDVVLYDSWGPYIVFTEHTGNTLKGYYPDYPDEFYLDLTASTSPVTLSIKDVCVVADGERYILHSSDLAVYDAFRQIADKNSGGLPIIYINGYGTAADFAGKDVSGKVAIVNRGSISFEEKALNATAAGAIGILFVDYANMTGVLNPNVGSATIPAAGVDNGVASHLSGKTWLQLENATIADMWF